MATYVQCHSCHKLTLKGSLSCETCGKPMGVAAADSAAVHMFPTGWWEHLALDPIYIKGRAHLRDVCADLETRAKILD